jgi:predicted RNA binding protein YcfA (HicA-like mRNA interferase family)
MCNRDSAPKPRGWVLVSTEGSHRQFKHPTKLGRLTVSGVNRQCR